MNKQEQIEEMAKIIDELYNVYDTTADEIAEGLYNAGYRKADAREACEQQSKIDVLNELRNRLVVYYPSVISVIDELLKEYENDTL